MYGDPSIDHDRAEGDASIHEVDQTLEQQLEGAEVPAHDEASWRDELAEAYEPAQDDWVVSEQDGLPTPANNSASLETAIPFTRDGVCTSDDSKWVSLYEREFVHSWAAKKFERLGVVASPPRYAFDGVENSRLVFDRAEVKFGWGLPYCLKDGIYYMVRPIRPQCVHYRRQCWANDEQKHPETFGHLVFTRSCMARRSVGGAFLSVSNECAYACEFRDPPDPTSLEKWIESLDRKRLDAGPAPMVPLFNSGKQGTP
jgi:hypothetical protein